MSKLLRARDFAGRIFSGFFGAGECAILQGFTEKRVQRVVFLW
jgi:hypothetical protein